MMRIERLASVAFGLIGALALPGQSEDGRQLAQRIRDGGWFEQSKYRRGDDGTLQMWSSAHTGDAATAEWVSLLGDQLGKGFANSGLLGLLSLVHHGAGDLLAMTDAEFHFGALGIDPTDVGLRQFLVVPPPSFDGVRGRAALLDRQLAVAVLLQRGCKAAVGELGVLAKNEALPAALRASASRALAILSGQPDPLERQRLAAASLQLPAAFDGCVVVDHARLPDMSWLTPLGRRLGALVTARAISEAGGSISEPMCNGAQMMCDVVSELPFGVAQCFGNARLDHSCLVISAKADTSMPFALTWEVAGAFEHEGWQAARVPVEAADWMPSATMAVEAARVFATTDGSKGMPRPALVEKLHLLRDTGEAIRAIVPANSKLWPALAFLQLPPAQGAELRISFGDPTVVVVELQARDEDAAQAWVEKGKALLVEAKAALDAQFDHLKAVADADVAEELLENKDLRRLLDSFFGASFAVKDSTAVATMEVRGFTAAKARAVFEVVAPLLVP